MIIPIVAGWGKKAKELAYCGINKCGNCKNYSHSLLFEVATKVDVWFLPIAKFGRKYYLVCGLCEAGVELDQGDKDVIVRESVSLPDMNTANEIWTAIDGIVAESIKADTLNEAGVDALGIAIDHLAQKYPESAVDYVRSVYLEWIQDPDQPE